MKNCCLGIVCCAVILILMGCATTVQIEVLKPAEVNMAGARTIAVMDVNYSSGGVSDLNSLFAGALQKVFFGETEEQRHARILTEYTTNKLTGDLLGTGYFTIVGTQDISRAYGGSDAPSVDPMGIGERVGAQAIIIGDITLLDYDDEYFTKTEYVYSDATQQSEPKEVQWVRRDAELNFSYRVVETKEGRLLTTQNFSETGSDEKSAVERNNLRPPRIFSERW